MNSVNTLEKLANVAGFRFQESDLLYKQVNITVKRCLKTNDSKLLQKYLFGIQKHIADFNRVVK